MFVGDIEVSDTDLCITGMFRSVKCDYPIAANHIPAFEAFRRSWSNAAQKLKLPLYEKATPNAGPTLVPTPALPERWLPPAQCYRMPNRSSGFIDCDPLLSPDYSIRFTMAAWQRGLKC